VNWCERGNAIPDMVVSTIGHSTRSIEDVIDIRTVPRSRANPQFNREALPAGLQAAEFEANLDLLIAIAREKIIYAGAQT
jgi:Protein of unknown function, DUF488